MKTIHLFFWLLMNISSQAFAQFIDTIQLKPNPPQKAIFITVYGDTKLMELHPNGKIYKFKDGLDDGKYIAFFDKVLSGDTAMVAVIKNGKINGLLQRWDNELHDLSEECEYVNGHKTGFRKLYFRPTKGVTLVNIQRWERDILQEDLIREW